MEKLDRLVWAAGFCGTSFGIRIGVRANTPEALEELRPMLPAGWRYTTQPVVDILYSLNAGGPETRPGVRRFNLLYVGAGRLARTPELEALFPVFENDLQLRVAEFAPRHVFVHAGVVGWRGRAIVLPGSSHSGKSTLTAALVRAGATYYSDEYAVFNRQERVQPYARPLQLRQSNGQAGEKVTAESLGGRTGVRSLPVGLVVETTFQPGCRWRPRKMSNGHGTLALLAHAIPIQRKPAWTMGVLSRALQLSCHLKGARGDAGAVADRLLSEFANW
jgi:hypothetical protein